MSDLNSPFPSAYFSTTMLSLESIYTNIKEVVIRSSNLSFGISLAHTKNSEKVINSLVSCHILSMHLQQTVLH